MNLRIAVAAAAAAVLTTTLLPTTPASAVVSYKRTDQVGDVKLGSETAGLSKAQRRTIDIKWVRLVTVEGGATRVTVKIGSVRPGLSEDQIIFLDTRPLPGKGAYPTLRAGWSVKSVTDGTGGLEGYATFQTSDDDFAEGCDPLPDATFNVQTDTISQVIPFECLPAGKQRVHVQSYIGPFRSEGIDVASDHLRFRGKVR